MSKATLVVSGGGAKGAFAVGAIDHLMNTLRLKFDIVSGTSTGALIAPLVILGEIEELKHVYTHINNEDILRKRELGLRDIFRTDAFNDTDPARALIEEHISKQRAIDIMSSDKQMYLTTINLQTGEIVYFYTGPVESVPKEPNSKAIKITSREMMINSMLASASIPIYMPPVTISLAPDRPQQYVDGGVLEVAPLKITIENGATDLYAIVLSPENDPETGEHENLFDIFLRTLNLLTRDVMINDIRIANLFNAGSQYINELRRIIRAQFNLNDSEVTEIFSSPNVDNPYDNMEKLSIHLIQPQNNAELTGDPEVKAEGLDFDPEKMAKMMEMGKKKAVEVLGNIPPRIT